MSGQAKVYWFKWKGMVAEDGDVGQFADFLLGTSRDEGFLDEGVEDKEEKKRAYREDLE